VFAPKERPYVEFESGEEISNYLLRDPEVQAYLRKRGGTPMIVMVFFDSETEDICRELGYQLILPSDELRRRLDSKIVTTQLGNEAGAPSVLGRDLVVQTPYGDSGKTTSISYVK
jgi:biotin carboxylase